MNDTPYYKARLRAAERDSAFESRQSAGAVIGIGSTRLYQIERGIRLPHEDEVIVMAKEYDAPSSSRTTASTYVPSAHTARRISTIDLRLADVSAGGNLHQSQRRS